MSRKSIRLFYWSSILFEGKSQENYGDVLSQFIVEQVSGKAIRYYNAPKQRKSWFPKKHLLAIGSILNYATAQSHVGVVGSYRRRISLERQPFTPFVVLNHGSAP